MIRKYLCRRVENVLKKNIRNNHISYGQNIILFITSMLISKKYIISQIHSKLFIIFFKVINDYIMNCAAFPKYISIEILEKIIQISKKFLL